VGWIGRSDLEAAGAKPPAHPYMRGCRAGHAGSCNAMGIAVFPPAAAAEAALSSSCELGYAPGCHHLGIAKQMRADVEADEEAVTAFSTGCRLGWAPACTRLGMMRRRGHIAPGAMSAKSAFQRGCEGGDLAGCFELGMLMRAQGGGDPKVGLKFLEGACQQGHTPSCAEVGAVRLREPSQDAEQRKAALGELRGACEAGGHRACLVLAEEVDGQGDERKLLDRAVTGGAAACTDGLAVCGGDAASTSASLGWATYEGSVARILEDIPPCGISLERACLVHRDALVKRCTLSGDTCFAAGETIRGLAGAGLSIGVGDARKVEERGVAWAKAACRKRNASACLALAKAYRRGRGTDEDAKKAERFAKRACQLDEGHCLEEK
jgi:TPR repeat protein